jgi:hypothetical protein
MKASFQTVCTLYKIFSTRSLFLNENNLMKIMIVKKRKGAKWHPFDHSLLQQEEVLGVISSLTM